MEPRRKNHSIRQRRLRQLRCIHRCRRRKRRRMEATDIQFRQRDSRSVHPGRKIGAFQRCHPGSGFQLPVSVGTAQRGLQCSAQRRGSRTIPGHTGPAHIMGRRRPFDGVPGCQRLRGHMAQTPYIVGDPRHMALYPGHRPASETGRRRRRGPRPCSCRRYTLLPERARSADKPQRIHGSCRQSGTGSGRHKFPPPSGAFPKPCRRRHPRLHAERRHLHTPFRRTSGKSECEHQRRLPRPDRKHIGDTRSPRSGGIAQRQERGFHIPRRRVCDSHRLQHNQTGYRHPGSRKPPLLGQRQHSLFHFGTRRTLQHLPGHTRPPRF